MRAMLTAWRQLGKKYFSRLTDAAQSAKVISHIGSVPWGSAAALVPRRSFFQRADWTRSCRLFFSAGVSEREFSILPQTNRSSFDFSA